MTDGATLRNGKKVTAIIQARMGSTRLPGKSLALIAGRPMLAHIIERVRQSQVVDDIMVATSDLVEDDLLAALARDCGVRVFRGDPDNVLDRFYQAAKQSLAGVIVRVTGDDPFKDPEVLDLIATKLLLNPDLDYVSNTIEPSYPLGLDVEAFTFDALARTQREASTHYEQEHVTPYIWQNTTKFKIRNVASGDDFSDLRWTVDYPADLEFARAVYGRLYRGSVFTMQDILTLLALEPALSAINQPARLVQADFQEAG